MNVDGCLSRRHFCNQVVDCNYPLLAIQNMQRIDFYEIVAILSGRVAALQRIISTCEFISIIFFQRKYLAVSHNK